MKKILIIFVIALTAYLACTPQNKNEYIQVKPQIPLLITPFKDTFNIGDTMYLEADFPDTMRNMLNGAFYKFENFDFYETLMFNKLVDTATSNQPTNIDNFKIINEVGQIVSVGSFADVKYLYQDGRYKLKSKIIPLSTGVQSITFSYLFSGKTRSLNIDLGPSEKGGKKFAYLYFIWHLINNGKTNFDIYKQHAKVGDIANADEYNYEAEGTYTFVVK